MLIAAAASARSGAGWEPVHEQQSKGIVSATLDYEERKFGEFVSAHRTMRLAITRAGRRVYERVLCGVVCSGPGIYTRDKQRRALVLRNVWGSAEPEVLVETYSGGAHCCLATVIVSRGKAGYRTFRHEWGDVGAAYKGQWRQGVYFFLSADSGFAYAFTSYAGSAFPAQAWTLTASGRLRDVTRERLDHVRGNAAKQWRHYNEERGGEGTIRGVLAAWCADQHLLGAGETCEAELERARQAGWLETANEDSSVSEYLAKLHRLLRVGGYIRG